MGTAENKAVQPCIIDEVINQKNLDLADDLFSEEHELHPEAPGVGRGPGRMKRVFAGLYEEFPDVWVEMESMVAEGDMAAVCLTFSGTHAPTGERAMWPRWSSRASPRARPRGVRRSRIPGAAGTALLSRTRLLI